MYCFVLLLRLFRKLESAGILWRKRGWEGGDLAIKDSLILCCLPFLIHHFQVSLGLVECSAAMGMSHIPDVQYGSLKLHGAVEHLKCGSCHRGSEVFILPN